MPLHARDRAPPRRADDPQPAPARLRGRKGRGHGYRLIAVCILLWLVFGTGLFAETIRIATYAAPLSRDGPGLLLRDILEGDEQSAAASEVVREIAPDILVLTDFDYDANAAALRAFGELAGGFDHHFALRPNAGLATGLDLDGNGRPGEARDAQGYGRFAGDGGLAILSRWSVDTDNVQDFSALLWRDLPGARLPRLDGDPFFSAEAEGIQRLSSTGHWIVPIAAPGGRISLLVSSATPPVFDGPEDRNGLRNRDELRLWEALLDGGIGEAPEGHYAFTGNTNLDPRDGEGSSAAMAAFLARGDIQDPRPESAGAAAAGDPNDTANWQDPVPGNLRVSYVLPSADWTVLRSGVFWPTAGSSGATLLGRDGNRAGPHRLVWVDVSR
ncbi:endonuclease/exonuclease/phosphatase family protein [Histidinibacterium aquaticum]|uniref:endonuclease/exonuclease/phosphatase family protein n=1 Tax=Histidinibacterium aquaticum TaxID=2613962 RepID=UPI001CC6B61B|nr:endonuclease/exonuclease/phosphatase family protein [Histidinibacterium aquaticum]